MARGGGMYVLVVCLTFVLGVYCIDDTVRILNSINRLKNQVRDIDDTIIQEIDDAKFTLRAELSQQLSEMLAEFIRESGSEEEISKKQLMMEVRMLKRSNVHIKKTLHDQMSATLKLRKELDGYISSVKKQNARDKEMTVCSKYIVDNRVLQRELDVFQEKYQDSRLGTADIDNDLQTLREDFQNLNRSCQCGNSEVTSKTIKRVTIPTSTGTPLTTTVRPENVRGRILVGVYSGSPNPIRSVDIKTNNVKQYSSFKLKYMYVTALSYIHSERKLLIGTFVPNRIVSSYLDSDITKVFRENVRTWGMAVDEERGKIFMTTNYPKKTVSHVTTAGSDFRAIVDLSSYGEWPRAISLDTNNRKIYACDGNKVFALNYDGSDLRTLATGNTLFGLTFSTTRNTLYFIDEKRIMSYSVNGTAEVALVDVVPWNLVYSRDTVYFSSSSDSPSHLGAIDLGVNTVVYTLRSNLWSFNARHSIVLVP